MLYRVYGIVLWSDVSFWQLVEEKKEVPYDFAIRIKCFPEEVKAHIKANPGPFGRGDGFCWFNTPGGYFAVIKGQEILTEESEEARLALMRTYLLGYGIAMLFLENGEMAVHCSAVAGKDGCLLLSGYSGAGKSTLAGQFLEQGWKLMADDVAMLWLCDDKLMTAPAFPVRKLCRDAALQKGYDLRELLYIDEDKDKYAVKCPEMFADGPARVKAMFVIKPYDGDEVKVQELTGQEKIRTFMKNLFLHVVFERDEMTPERFFKCLEILEKLPLYLLYRPLRVADSAREMADLILTLQSSWE